MKFFIILSFVGVAAAQTGSSSGAVVSVAGPVPGSLASNSPWFSSAGPMIGGRAVIGAPYSAEEVTEHVQTLADRTHITQPVQRTKFYRDSQGRTRIERTFPVPPGASRREAAGPTFIEISDSVSSVRYTLEPRNHTAHKWYVPTELPPPPPPPSSAATSARKPGFPVAQVVPGPASTARVRTHRNSRSFLTSLWEPIRWKASWLKVTAPR